MSNTNTFSRLSVLLLLVLLGSALMMGNSLIVKAGGSSLPAAARVARSSLSATPKSDEQWRAVLSPNAFAVLRKKATEPPGFSEQTPGELEYELKKTVGSKYPKEGTFDCAGCGTPLYKAATKFDSGCGWPAFFQGIDGAIKEVPDADGRRVEIVCANCDGHLGHVFKNEGFANPTNERHCVNGISISYKPST